MAIDPRTDRRTGERVYLEIKNAILAGRLKLRQRLDIDTLASQFRASATPVRQALAILASERLVTAHAARGYYVAFWSERELRALYEWRWHLARIAADTHEALASDTRVKGSVLDIYHALMRRLERNANEELRRVALNADDRLHAALVAEAEVLSDVVEELNALSMVLNASDRRKLQRRLKSFFRHRMDAAAQIRARASIAALPANGD